MTYLKPLNAVRKDQLLSGLKVSARARNVSHLTAFFNCQSSGVDYRSGYCIKTIGFNGLKTIDRVIGMVPEEF